MDLEIATHRSDVPLILSELRTKLLHNGVVGNNSDCMNGIFRDIVQRAQFHSPIDQNETTLLVSVNEVQNFPMLFTKCIFCLKFSLCLFFVFYSIVQQEILNKLSCSAVEIAAFRELRNCSDEMHSRIAAIKKTIDAQHTDIHATSLLLLKEKIEKAKKLCKANLEAAFLISFATA
jgi:hypothetical protein